MSVIPVTQKSVISRLFLSVSSAYGAMQNLFNQNLLNSAAVMLLVSLLAGNAVRADERPVILALGDSLTAGYGLESGQAFPDILQQALAEKNIPARVINGGVSGDTTAGGRARLDWMMMDNPDLVIVELGANDGLRALNPADTRKNMEAILAYLSKRQVKVLLTGMLAPPNLGIEYEKMFNSIYPELAEKYQVPFYPFFLEGVVNNPELNQSDGIHPNLAGVNIIVERILPHVIKALQMEKTS